MFPLSLCSYHAQILHGTRSSEMSCSCYDGLVAHVTHVASWYLHKISCCKLGVLTIILYDIGTRYHAGIPPVFSPGLFSYFIYSHSVCLLVTKGSIVAMLNDLNGINLQSHTGHT